MQIAVLFFLGVLCGALASAAFLWRFWCYAERLHRAAVGRWEKTLRRSTEAIEYVNECEQRHRLAEARLATLLRERASQAGPAGREALGQLIAVIEEHCRRQESVTGEYIISEEG